ncbi:pyridoxamine 5'-phosphate oxidase-related, FMN-binding protein [Richelia sinica FACHB-800]|uniref:Pyridoxamine 5'-phosphate oxidase-related, FMN-binding protein n=2 Tax=Richelia TaxID=98443 RepID=A0A975Y399_9NOST|nr:pyridoxamine 5'-phosphate oxidase family protein [Richelia sinica FACHB-800]QXE21900.1 pyridoxamine 5'-phosphate oxidase-related, FMN-binding protein [Richelia sinica FACHB-800]
MLDIDEMSTKEIHNLLQKVGHGHLGCALEGHPYVVPMHYYFDDPDIYIFTTIGMKTKYMDANPEVCLQVEEVEDLKHWRSVTVTGKAEHITEQKEIDRVMEFVKTQNPTLYPAINRTWIDAWGRDETMALYRIHPSEMSGRTTEGVSSRHQSD